MEQVPPVQAWLMPGAPNWNSRLLMRMASSPSRSPLWPSPRVVALSSHCFLEELMTNLLGGTLHSMATMPAKEAQTMFWTSTQSEPVHWKDTGTDTLQAFSAIHLRSTPWMGLAWTRWKYIS